MNVFIKILRHLLFLQIFPNVSTKTKVTLKSKCNAAHNSCRISRLTATESFVVIYMDPGMCGSFCGKDRKGMGTLKNGGNGMQNTEIEIPIFAICYKRASETASKAALIASSLARNFPRSHFPTLNRHQ